MSHLINITFNFTTKCHIGTRRAWHFTTKCYIRVKEVRLIWYSVTKCYIPYGEGTVNMVMSHSGTPCINNVTFQYRKVKKWQELSGNVREMWENGRKWAKRWNSILGRNEMSPPDVMKCHIRHFKCHIRHSCVTTWDATRPTFVWHSTYTLWHANVRAWHFECHI